jgi:hypothetical protein
MPSLVQMDQRLKDKGIAVLGVSIDVDADAYHRFLKDYKVGFVSVRDPEQRAPLFMEPTVGRKPISSTAMESFGASSSDRSTGASPKSVLPHSWCKIAGGRERQDASAKQFKSGSAIHLALQCLQSIDVTFDRTIAPALFDGRLDCTLVLLQHAHKTLHFVEAGRVGLLHPRVQRLDLARP